MVKCPDCGKVLQSKQALGGHRSGCDGTPEEVEEAEIRRLYFEEGMSQRGVAEEMGFTHNQIFRRFKKYGIDSRSIGEGKRLQHKNDVSISVPRDRYRIEFRQFGEHIQFPLAKLAALLENPADEVFNNDIHHKNGHPIDDRPENLEVLCRGEHSKKHDSLERPDPEEISKWMKEATKNRERDEKGRFT